MENSNEDGKSTKTDKWGYVVCFSTVIIFIAGIGHVNSFGLIYKDFIVDTHSSAKSLTTAHGVFSIMLAIGGLVLNMVRKRYSLRSGGVVGAVIMSTGSFATVFISSTNQLAFTFGVLQGVGFGMLVPVCYSTFNHYFVRKRTQVMSFIKAIQGSILIFYPQVVKMLLSHYGFRSTLLLLSGMSLQSLPGVFTMKTITRTPKNRTTLEIELENGAANPETADLIDKHKIAEESPVKVIENNLPTRFKHISTMVLEMLNIKILKDPVFCNICIGQSFVNFSDLLFFVLQPMLLYQYGMNTNEVAACISISAGSDVAGRFGLAFISGSFTIDTRVLFYTATMFTFAARIVFLQVRQFVWIAAVTILLGVLRAFLHVASPLVISHNVRHEDFTGAYALFMLSTGLANVIFSPIIGLIKDVYHDYTPAFYALTACCLPCLCLWPAEYYIKNK